MTTQNALHFSDRKMILLKLYVIRTLYTCGVIAFKYARMPPHSIWRFNPNPTTPNLPLERTHRGRHIHVSATDGGGCFAAPPREVEWKCDTAEVVRTDVVRIICGRDTYMRKRRIGGEYRQVGAKAVGLGWVGFCKSRMMEVYNVVQVVF